MRSITIRVKPQRIVSKEFRIQSFGRMTKLEAVELRNRRREVTTQTSQIVNTILLVVNSATQSLNTIHIVGVFDLFNVFDTDNLIVFLVAICFIANKIARSQSVNRRIADNILSTKILSIIGKVIATTIGFLCQNTSCTTASKNSCGARIILQILQQREVTAQNQTSNTTLNIDLVDNRQIAANFTAIRETRPSNRQTQSESRSSNTVQFNFSQDCTRCQSCTSSNTSVDSVIKNCQFKTVSTIDLLLSSRFNSELNATIRNQRLTIASQIRIVVVIILNL